MRSQSESGERRALWPHGSVTRGFVLGCHYTHDKAIRHRRPDDLARSTCACHAARSDRSTAGGRIQYQERVEDVTEALRTARRIRRDATTDDRSAE